MNATGLPAGQVYFANQNGPQPASAPFVSILISSEMLAPGTDDELFRSYDSVADKVDQLAIGIRDFTVSIQAYAEGVVTGAQSTAVGLLTSVQTALALESVRFSLTQANIAPYDRGQIRRLDAIVETGFEGRAALDVRFYGSDSQLEAVDRIIEVTGSFQIND